MPTDFLAKSVERRRAEVEAVLDALLRPADAARDLGRRRARRRAGGSTPRDAPRRARPRRSRPRRPPRSRRAARACGTRPATTPTSARPRASSTAASRRSRSCRLRERRWTSSTSCVRRRSSRRRWPTRRSSSPSISVEAESGGGLVKVTMNGKCEVTRLVVDPKAVDPADKAMLEDLVTAAVNAARREGAHRGRRAPGEGDRRHQDPGGRRLAHGGRGPHRAAREGAREAARHRREDRPAARVPHPQGRPRPTRASSPARSPGWSATSGSARAARRSPTRIPAASARTRAATPSIICVVEGVPDLLAIERTHEFRGRYHVLHGVLSPLDGIGPPTSRSASCSSRLEREPGRARSSSPPTPTSRARRPRSTSRSCSSRSG